MFKNPRNKTLIVHMARQVYPENISSFNKTYLQLVIPARLFILGSNTTD